MKQVFFKNISIKNFLSIGNEPVDIIFNKGFYIITGLNKDKEDRRNGVGKTTILNAIYFAVFGDTIDEIKKDLIPNNITNKSTEVQLSFSIQEGDNINQYKIVRTLKPSKCYIFVNDIDKTLDSISNTDTFIQDILCATPERFKNGVIMTLNNTVPFMAKGKLEKRKFIESLFNLEFFTDMLKSVRNDYNETQKEQELLSTKCGVVDNQLKTHLKQKEDNIKYIDSVVNSLRQRIVKQEQEKEEIKSKIVTIDDSKIDAANQKIINCNSDQAVNKKQIDDYNVQINNIQTKINDCNIEKSNIVWTNEEVKKVQAEMSLLSDKVKKIEIDENNISRHPTYIENVEKMSKYTTEIKELKNQLSSIDKDDAIVLYNDTISRLQTSIDLTNKQLKVSGTSKDKCPVCLREVDDDCRIHIEIEKKKIQDSIKEYEECIQTTKKDILIYKKEKNEDVNNKIIKNVIEHGKITKEQNKFLEDSAKQYLQDKENIKKQHAELNDKINLIVKERGVVIDKNIKELEEQIKGISNNIQELNNKNNVLVNVITKLNTYITDINNQKLQNKLYKEKIEQIDKWITELKNDIETAEKKRNDFDEVIEKVSKELSRYTVDLETLKYKLHILDICKLVVSEEGVKSYIVKKLLDLFNNRIAYYIKRLDGNSICKFNEYFEEEIFNERGKPVSYFNFSGAERKTIDLACLFTFADLQRFQGMVTYNLGIYDELFDTSIDEKGVELVLSILTEKVEQYNECIMVISHRKEAINKATHGVIYLEKEKGITQKKEYCK